MYVSLGGEGVVHELDYTQKMEFKIFASLRIKIFEIKNYIY